MAYKLIEGGGVTTPKGFQAGGLLRGREEPQERKARRCNHLFRTARLLRGHVHHQ